MTARPSSALTSFVVASRYLPVYLAIVVLVVVAVNIIGEELSDRIGGGVPA